MRVSRKNILHKLKPLLLPIVEGHNMHFIHTLCMVPLSYVLFFWFVLLIKKSSHNLFYCRMNKGTHDTLSSQKSNLKYSHIQILFFIVKKKVGS